MQPASGEDKTKAKKTKIKHTAVFTQKQQMYIFPEFKDESSGKHLVSSETTATGCFKSSFRL